MLLILLLYALFASVFTIAKTGLEYSSPFFFVGARMFFAGILLTGYYLYAQRGRVNWSRLPYGKIILLGLFNIYLTNIFELWGLQYLTSFKACFIYSLSPFFSALISYFIFSERMTWKKWLGLLVGVGGMTPILLNQNTLEEATGQLFFFSWAEIALILAAVCSVYGWIILRQIMQEEISPIIANGLSMLIGGGVALGHSYFSETWAPFPVTEAIPFVECSLLLILISNIICYNLYGHLLKRYSATFISFAGFTTPLFTAFFGWLYLSEEVTLSFYLSALLVFFGLGIFYQGELQKEYVPSASTL